MRTSACARAGALDTAFAHKHGNQQLWEHSSSSSKSASTSLKKCGTRQKSWRFTYLSMRRTASHNNFHAIATVKTTNVGHSRNSVWCLTLHDQLHGLLCCGLMRADQKWSTPRTMLGFPPGLDGCRVPWVTIAHSSAWGCSATG